MTKKIIVHEEFCIACRLCEVACIVEHSKSKNIIKTFKEEVSYREAEPLIKFEEEGYASFGLPCRHCEDAPCIESCMTGALSRDSKTDAVLLDQEKCVGCNMCVMACPYGVITPTKKDGKKVASKCDLCVDEVTGEAAPACVLICPNEALTFDEIDENGKVVEKEDTFIGGH